MSQGFLVKEKAPLLIEVTAQLDFNMVKFEFSQPVTEFMIPEDVAAAMAVKILERCAEMRTYQRHRRS